MLFDTGADNITISRKDLSALGVLLPLDGIRGSVRGVGKPLSSTLKSSATVKVGNYLRENFPINIQEDSFLQPVIGINFFQNCLVTVDVDHSRIVLSSESQVSGGTASTSSGVSHAVTVSFSGNQLLVPVTVNGCATSMLLDSGADCITFSQEQAAAMHLVVPADARPEVHMGVGGAVKGVGFTLSECAVGPLSKQNVKVSVIESPGMPYPLMGAEFLKDCIYTINKEHSQITFERI